MPSFQSIVTQYFVPLLPGRRRLPFIYRRYCAAHVAEQELVHLERIPTRFRVAVDIGANQGLYSYKMSRHYREVFAFEVNGDLTANLRRLAAGNVRVFNQGLSSREGAATLYTPVLENGFALTGWAGISRKDIEQEFVGRTDKIRYAEKPVHISTLDRFQLTEVDLIKIDVEGHEAEVLKGAQDTLKRNRPHILVETKGRADEVDKILTALDYHRLSFQELTGLRELAEFFLYVPV